MVARVSPTRCAQIRSAGVPRVRAARVSVPRSGMPDTVLMPRLSTFPARGENCRGAVFSVHARVQFLGGRYRTREKVIVVRGFGRAHNDLIGSARGVYMGINRRVRERD